MKILELKSIKLEGINCTFALAEERTGKFEDKSETSQSKEQREKVEKNKVSEKCETPINTPRILGLPEGEESRKVAEINFIEVILKKFLNFNKNINLI